MKKLLLSLLLGIASQLAYGQFSISAEIRPRSELRHGYKTLISDDQRAAFFTEQRSRLYMDFTNEKIILRLALQDVRIWGEDDQIFKSDYAMFSVSEAWAAYQFTPKFALKFGRQILSYDNQRFLGGLEWAQQGRRHDALLGIFKDPERNLELHAGVAYNQDGDIPEPKKLTGTYYARNNYKTMQYVWFNKKTVDYSLSLLAFNEGRQYGNGGPDSVSNRQTFGMVAARTTGLFKFGGEAYVQTGKLADQKVLSYFFDLNATLTTTLTPLTIGYQFLSGQSGDTDRVTAFDPAYGTNHMHNGFMDYFYVGSGHQNKGLQDIYLKTRLKLSANKNLIVHLHEFLTVSEVLDENLESMSNVFGTEIDVVLDWRLQENVRIHLGSSYMLATSTMQAVKGGDRTRPQYWAWAMITFTPTLFTTRKPETTQQ